MKNRVFASVIFFMSFVFFSCSDFAFNSSTGKISIPNLPYGISKQETTAPLEEPFVEPVQVSYVFYLMLESNQDSEKREIKAYSADSVLVEDLNPGMWTVTVAATVEEYEERLQHLVEELGSSIYEIGNSKTDFSFCIGQTEVEVKPGEVADAVLKLQRILVAAQRIAGIKVDFDGSDIEAITIDNFDDVKSKCISAKLIIENYVGEKLESTDYDEIPFEDLEISELSERDVGYVPVTVSYQLESDYYSETVKVPVTFIYPVPEFDTIGLDTSFSLEDSDEAILIGDPFRREYSDILVSYYDEEAVESEEIVLVLEPESVTWYKDGEIFRKAVAQESEEGKVLDCNLVVGTEIEGTSVYSCVVDCNLIAKSTPEVLDFITPLTAQLTSPEYTVEVKKGEEPIEETVYYITFETDGGSEMPVYSYVAGQYVDINDFVPTKEGYVFVGWTFEDKLIDTIPEGNITLKASWSALAYQVIFEVNGGTLGEISPSYMYTYGEEFTIPVPTRAGYKFLYWITEDEEIVETSADIPLAEPYQTVKLTAVWEANKYTLTFVTKIEDVELDPIEFTYGEIIELPKIEKAGYEFQGWYEESAPNTIVSGGTLDRDYDLIAKWNPITFTVIFDLNGGEGESSISYTYDDELPTLEDFEPTKEGYVFKGWTRDGKEISALDKSGSYTVTAVWEKTSGIIVSFEIPSDPGKITITPKQDEDFVTFTADISGENLVWFVNGERADENTNVFEFSCSEAGVYNIYCIQLDASGDVVAGGSLIITVTK